MRRGLTAPRGRRLRRPGFRPIASFSTWTLLKPSGMPLLALAFKRPGATDVGIGGALYKRSGKEWPLSKCVSLTIAGRCVHNPFPVAGGDMTRTGMEDVGAGAAHELPRTPIVGNS